MTSRKFRNVLVLVLVALVGVGLAAKTCPNCGESNRDDVQFCKNCGYRFPAQAAPPAVRTLPQLRADISVASGVVSIRSTPAGAAVRVDGRSRGTTPLEIADLAPGQHAIELSRAGYRSYDGIFVIPKLDGTIVVTTVPPGAEVLLDGKPAGIAGDSGLVIQDVGFGSHVLLARLGGYPDEVRTIVLARDAPVNLTTISFTGRVGFLRVESDPIGAALEVDGTRVGNTNYIGTMAPANYRLKLSYPGFRDWTGSARVELRDTAYVFATMAAIRERKPAFLWLGVAGVAGGVAGAVMGELAYREYQEAQPPEYTSADIQKLREQTQLYDWLRNIAGTVGVLSLGAYLVF
ncbi:PEGA domain-containing protein [candidate division WOR-3 bacterium]|nr:PEGA domain-containing protein [candidate division WOR-3 bacterium]